MAEMVRRRHGTTRPGRALRLDPLTTQQTAELTMLLKQAETIGEARVSQDDWTDNSGQTWRAIPYPGWTPMDDE